MLDQGRVEQARHYLRLGEDQNVFHEQVKQARFRLMDVAVKR